MKRLLLFLPLFFTACGSGGGASSSAKNPDKPQSKVDKTSVENKKDINKKPPKNTKRPDKNPVKPTDNTDNILGTWGDLYKKDDHGHYMGNLIHSTLINSQNKKDAIKYLTIDGHTFSINIGDNQTTLGRLTKVIDGEDGSFVFGAINGKNKDLNGKEKMLSSIFYKGLLTTDNFLNPSNDVIATYTGNAYAIKEDLAGIYKGKVNATINFGEDKIGGTLSGFGENIKDIDFSGHAIGGDLFGVNDNGTELNGKIFGEHIAGVVETEQNDKDVVASFGAKKQ
ncbi:hypothetical protein [Pasteurella atlantica]|uniref:hypothetical protein n=1 Tax=Pasteurellaceae TaxID=712 RepID=UPI002746B0EF|nr:hypothetical protein [Pasteurella atlantica]MDP8098430.1 hypothetical protein [Pasteurella atlantica]MDP8106456.1 hypothetical protein [Pasteurella atlantica]MDP8116233.1 hypothetical protein [Pasteurella atlantica]